MKILIIGSRGTLGQYLQETLKPPPLTRGAGGVIAWDKAKLDITKQKEVLQKIGQLKPDIIINCAAHNDVDGAETNAELVNLINGCAVGYLAQAAKQINALIIHFSTGYVFKGNNPNGYTETDQPDPQSAYARSKFLGEQELQKYTDKYYLIRTSRLFGKQGSAPNSKKPFIDLITEIAEKNNNKIKAVDEEYDLPTYALDLAKKVKEIIKNSPLPCPPPGGTRGVKYGIYHISNSGEPCTWHGFAREIFKIKNIPVEIKPVGSGTFGKRPAKRPACAVLKNTKLKPLRNWQEALREYLLK